MRPHQTAPCHFVIDPCSEAEREKAEAIIHAVLAGRKGSEWMVALRRVRSGWDVFIDGPDPDLCARLKQSLREAGFR